MQKTVWTVFFLFLGISVVYSQGCSDAGICFANSQKRLDGTERNKVEAGYTFGKGLGSVYYQSGFLNYNRTVSSKVSFFTRVTYNQAQGNFGTLGQLGDIVLLGNYRIKSKSISQMRATAGLKIPLSLANFKINNFALPMDYQPSLGTIDLFLGAEIQMRKISFNTAIQIPIFQTNKNSFFDEYSVSNEFPSTNLLNRRPDVLLGANYSLETKKWSFRPNIIAIYHIGNDTYIDIFNKQQTLIGSSGLTVNLGLATAYNVTAKQSFHLNIAEPIIVRLLRPDGLTRAYIASVSYSRKF